MAVSFTLADNTRVRYATGAIMYFAQGIPQGLLAITIPGSGAMVTAVGPGPTHIQYETCSSCNGSYLDAGELKDLFTIDT